MEIKQKEIKYDASRGIKEMLGAIVIFILAICPIFLVIFGYLARIGFYALLIYVAYHFLSKWW